MGMRWNTRMRFRCRQHLEVEKSQRLEYCNMVDTFETHPDLIKMRSAYTVNFHEVFGMGYQNYTEGEWKAASLFLRKALKLLNIPDFEDGPSLALLRFMHCYSFTAPGWWKGYHQLEDWPEASPRLSSLASGDLGPAVKLVASEMVMTALQEIVDEEPANLG